MDHVNIDSESDNDEMEEQQPRPDTASENDEHEMEDDTHHDEPKDDSSDDEQGPEDDEAEEPNPIDEESSDEEEDEPAAASSSSSSQPARRPIDTDKYQSVDSDSESDYASDSGTSGDESDSDDDDSDVKIHHEIQTDPARDEACEPRYPRAVGVESVGTRGTVKTFSTYDLQEFDGQPLGFDNKNFPRHYGNLSIVGRLRMDIKDNEIDHLKWNSEISAISRNARDMYRILFFSLYRSIIHKSRDIERGRLNKAPKSIPDEAVNEALHMYFVCPKGRT